MTPTPYFSSVISESAFRARFQAENGKNFSQLKVVAASYWGRPHLLACRVVRRDPQRNLLPILSQYVTTSDIHSSSNEISAFLQGPDLTFMAQSEHYLVRRSNCGISLAQIWAAMAMFKGNQDRRTRDIPTMQEQNESKNDNDDEARQPKRLRRHTFQPDFADSSEIQVGSSSPPQDGSYNGSQGSSLGYVDPDTHYLGTTPEDDTLRLASCVIRHILYFASPQNSASNPIVVEFRDAKTRLAATTTIGDRQIVTIDDGGLCLRRQNENGNFILANNHVAVLEAKTQFQCLESGRPIISDRSFAQMICEALATRLSNGGNS
ncbi:hypothetical protein N7516_010196 [Penicillium verrucosum]|uniref:uncharacterized protein n=1 Tax=Penicillium verrucosum TaxID=60171 RepID=UPI002544D7BD|nr:uncharacterized protein N7516_010196 [Penicillium verrucosum]KAJ5922493.1 hypothetical protein N7516_010196 [Penicillium verrucosum]